jgi:hypothetical protein
MCILSTAHCARLNGPLHPRDMPDLTHTRPSRPAIYAHRWFVYPEYRESIRKTVMFPGVYYFREFLVLSKNVSLTLSN